MLQNYKRNEKGSLKVNPTSRIANIQTIFNITTI